LARFVRARYIGFLDTIAGRGVLIVFVALRVMTLAQCDAL
jgi:hypothetical protein